MSPRRICRTTTLAALMVSALTVLLPWAWVSGEVMSLASVLTAAPGNPKDAYLTPSQWDLKVDARCLVKWTGWCHAGAVLVGVCGVFLAGRWRRSILLISHLLCLLVASLFLLMAGASGWGDRASGAGAGLAMHTSWYTVLRCVVSLVGFIGAVLALSLPHRRHELPQSVLWGGEGWSSGGPAGPAGTVVVRTIFLGLILLFMALILARFREDALDVLRHLLARNPIAPKMQTVP